MIPFDDRRQWPGTVPAVSGTPERPAESVRRTTSVDLLRPDGLLGPLHLIGAGRDLVTDTSGHATAVDTATTTVIVDYSGKRSITTIAADPAPVGLDALVGVRVGSGFRRTLTEALPGLADSGSLTHLILDDLTPAVLISSSAILRDDSQVARDPVFSAIGSKSPVNVCAGWKEGGALLAAVAEVGVPLLGWGPPAPSLASDDALAWHDLEPLAPTSMRRRRLIDVTRSEAADGSPEWAVAVRFRDTYWEDDGTETIVHEYSVDVTVDAATGRVTSALAVPGPLPAPDCPAAAASASNLVGLDVGSLREKVRADFTGVSTCTHLNDIFRSLADVVHLAALVPGDAMSDDDGLDRSANASPPGVIR